MAGFVEVVSRMFRPYKNYIIFISMLIVFLAVGVYGFKRYYSTPNKTKEYKDVANANRRNPEIEVMLFWADWCAYCKKAKPDWVAFKQEFDGQIINGYQIKCTDVDCSNDKDADIQSIMSKYKVKSYPTVVGLKNSEQVEFDAKISKSSLEQFIRSLATSSP
jgi:thiol-disulfide isomerase/thioredoxin